MTEQEIEKLARKGWQDLHERSGEWRSPTGDEWEYYLQAWKDSISVLYTEEDILKIAGSVISICNTLPSTRIVKEIQQQIEQLKQQRS